MQIKQVFDNECSQLKIDHAFFKKLCSLEASFVNKKEEHVRFFGGILTGVEVVRFTTEDRAKLFDGILELDEGVISDQLDSLKDASGNPLINKDWIVSSDVFNIASIWLLHAIDNSRYLSDSEIKEAKIRVCLYLFYRFVTSILFNFFPYPADREIAQATYESLSYKFILKKTGSWSECLRYISENSVAKDGIHSKTISKLADDGALGRMINDLQGRIKDSVKNIVIEFYKVKQQGVRIGLSSSFIETDGELALKDKTKNLSNYIRYVKSIVPDKNSFIKQPLIDVIANIMQTMPEKSLQQALEWTSSNYGHLSINHIETAIDAIMEHAFDYLSENKELLHDKANIAQLIYKLRGTYMSSRSNDSLITKARDSSKLIIASSVKSKNESILAATRTGWMLYIVLRSLTMKHYSN